MGMGGMRKAGQREVEDDFWRSGANKETEIVGWGFGKEEACWYRCWRWRAVL